MFTLRPCPPRGGGPNMVKTGTPFGKRHWQDSSKQILLTMESFTTNESSPICLHISWTAVSRRTTARNRVTSTLACPSDSRKLSVFCNPPPDLTGRKLSTTDLPAIETRPSAAEALSLRMLPMVNKDCSWAAHGGSSSGSSPVITATLSHHSTMVGWRWPAFGGREIGPNQPVHPPSVASATGSLLPSARRGNIADSSNHVPTGAAYSHQVVAPAGFSSPARADARARKSLAKLQPQGLGLRGTGLLRVD